MHHFANILFKRHFPDSSLKLCMSDFFFTPTPNISLDNFRQNL